jgi:hypothetical protein
VNTSLEIKYVVKVADFGLSRSMEGTKQYYASTSAQIPIKWTARTIKLIEIELTFY